MFILKSFFAEPMAILRPFGNGSATGRVLALITAMAGAVLIALQPVQAQEADFYATLYENVEDGADKIILTFKPTLGTGRAPNSAEQDMVFVFTQKYRDLDGLAHWTGAVTPATRAGAVVVPYQNLTAPTGSNIATTGAAGYATVLGASVSRIQFNLKEDHRFKAGDILTVISGNFAAGGNTSLEAGWKVQFTTGLEELSWGGDESLYTIGAPKLDTAMEYALSGVPGGSDGIGDVSYSFGSGSLIEGNNGLSHVSGRNVLRVAADIQIPTTIPSSCSGHFCLDKYTATDGNGASIQRTIIVFIVEQLHSDDVASGIPTLQQQMEGGVAVYAKEMFGADSANLVLLRGKYGTIGMASDGVGSSPTDPTGFFVLQFRKPVDKENSGQVTLTLHGAALGDVMAPSHVKVIRGAGGTESERDREIANVTVQRRQGGNVGDNQVVFQIATGSTDDIKIGDYIRFEIPALMGTNLGNDEMVFISAAVSSVSKSGKNNFPDGADGVSKCLSERIAGARECIFAKSAEAVMVRVDGYANRAEINVSDRTRAASPKQDTPNTSVTLTPDAISDIRSNKSANVFDLGKAHISIVYGTQVHVRDRQDTSFPSSDGIEYVPIFNASGEIFASNSVSPNDFFHLQVTPVPSHGALVAAEYANNSHQQLQSVQQSSYQGRLQDVLDKDGDQGKKTLVKSLLYVPSGAIDSTGATPLEHGEIYNMTASVDFNNASFADKTSSPNTTAFELSSVESKAIAYAIPPPSSPDDAFIRIRCENSSGCDVSLRCSNQTGAAWFGELSGRVNHNATEVLTAEEIADILSGEGFDASRHWGGPSNGRLSCEVMTRGGAVSTQVLVRSGGILTNNTNVSMGGTPGGS